MRLILEKIDDEVFVDLVLSPSDIDELKDFQLLSKETVFQGKVWNFAVRHQIADDDDENPYEKWSD